MNPDCERCQGRGWVEDGTDERRMTRCSCYDPRGVIWARAGVPTEYRRPFEDLDAWPIDDRPGRGVSVAEWRGSPPFVTIRGEFGVGKTRLAVELLDRLVLAKVAPSYRFVSAADVPSICFAADATEWRALQAEPALLLDDLGRGYQGDAAMAVSRLVSNRWSWRLPTVFPTNLGAAGGVTDGALLDRLSSGLIVQIDVIDGESRRRPRA